MWSYFVKGGMLMYPLALCSVIALAVIIERFLSYQRMKVNSQQVLGEIRQALKQGNPEQAVAVCKGKPSYISKVLAVGLENKDYGKIAVQEALEIAGLDEVSRLEKYLPILATVGTLAPLLGFTGTVTGMIRAFNAIAAAGISSPPVVAAGIAEALITTAYGLFIAIPTFFFYNYFAYRVEKMTAQIEKSQNELLDILFRG